MNFKPRNTQNDNASSTAANAAVKRAESAGTKSGTGSGMLGKLAFGGTLVLAPLAVVALPSDANADTCTVQRIKRNVPAQKQMTAVVLSPDNAVVVRVRDGAGRGVHIAISIPSSVSAPTIDPLLKCREGCDAESERAALTKLLAPNLVAGVSAMQEKLGGDKAAKSAEFECVSPASKAKKPDPKAGKAAPQKGGAKAPVKKGGDDLFGGLLPGKPGAKAEPKTGAVKPKLPAAKAETAAAQPKAKAMLTLTTQELLTEAAQAYMALVQEGTVKPVPGKLSLRVKVNGEGRGTKVVGAKGAKEYKANKELVTAIAQLLSNYTFPEAKRGRDTWVEFDFTSIAKSMAKKPAKPQAQKEPDYDNPNAGASEGGQASGESIAELLDRMKNRKAENGPAPAPVLFGRGKDGVDRMIRSLYPRINALYQSTRNDDPDMALKWTATVTIGKDGKVSGVSNLAGPALKRSVSTFSYILRSARFVPAPSESKIDIVFTIKEGQVY